jgi:hypothetical protein
MGLTSFAFRRTGAGDGDMERLPRELFDEVPAVLAGNFAEKGNTGSFDGKRYAMFVQQVTGHNLYRYVIETGEVGEIADHLQEFKERQVPEPTLLNTWGLRAAEVDALARWFRAVADNRGVVVGSW